MNRVERMEQHRARLPRAAKERTAMQTAAMQTATADSASSGLAASAASVDLESAGGSASCGQTTCEPGPHVTSRSSDQQTLCATDMGSQSARGPDVSEPMSPCGGLAASAARLQRAREAREAQRAAARPRADRALMSPRGPRTNGRCVQRTWAASPPAVRTSANRCPRAARAARSRSLRC